MAGDVSASRYCRHGHPGGAPGCAMCVEYERGKAERKAEVDALEKKLRGMRQNRDEHERASNAYSEMCTALRDRAERAEAEIDALTAQTARNAQIFDQLSREYCQRAERAEAALSIAVEALKGIAAGVYSEDDYRAERALEQIEAARKDGV